MTASVLGSELRRWRAEGLRPTLWWRDDDAGRASPRLDRLLALATALEVPLALAVVPAALEPSAADAIASCACATPVQHGYAHRNHAPAGARKCELGDERPLPIVSGELAEGSAVLGRRFGPRFAAVLVPPWNRVATGVLAALPALGFRGVSTYGPRSSASSTPGLRQCNAHVDIVDWRGSRRFVGAEAADGMLAAHLAGRREGRVDRLEPTGILTHHLVHDEAAWQWLRALVEATRADDAAAWIDAGAAFGPGTSATCGRFA